MPTTHQHSTCNKEKSFFAKIIKKYFHLKKLKYLMCDMKKVSFQKLMVVIFDE